MLKFLEGRKENKSCYRASRVAVTVSVSTYSGYILLFQNVLQQHRGVYANKNNFVLFGQVLDDTFGSQMQRLVGNVLQEKDLEPPRCILEVRSMLCKDVKNNKGNNYYY